MLKAELHIHSREDPQDLLTYSAKSVINYCSRLGYDVLSITLHNKLLFNKALNDYAKKRGVLLIPGAEVTIEGKHVLVYDVKKEDLKNLKTFSDLERVRSHALVVAPHPYYFRSDCLGKELEKHINLFDAIEHNHFYVKFINRNKKAVQVAKKYKKPLLATSDVHWMETIGYTYSLIDANPTKEDVLEAVRKNKIKIVSRPLPFWLFSKITLKLVWSTITGNYGKKKAHLSLRSR
jgi:hypothetical protein